jgi:acyl-coenzyme A synthetase/AMP-(fatty) acid ligase/acyl carrier protein
LAENALRLRTLPSAQDVTLIHTVPSAIDELVRVDGVPASTRIVSLGGEPLQNVLAQRIYQRETIQQVLNFYGPTEDTVWSTVALVERGASEPPTIGHPVPNTRIYLLDQHLRLVPIGARGELHIGGAGLARGYLNRPHLTAEKFIPDPFSNEPGARLYKTGDLARYRTDGSLEFLGRLDHQVNIQGYRIELGEIEAALVEHLGVDKSVVMAREDDSSDKHLVAYVVANGQPAPSTSELRGWLKEKLPEYMLPSAFVLLAALPLTLNGKVDRKALPDPDHTRSELEGANMAPRTPQEETLARIWAEVLGLERMSIQDDFFKLGGDSLLAAQAISRVCDAFEVELPLRTLFERTTIAELAVPVAEAVLLAEIEKLSNDEVQELPDEQP